jgi:hypothetical protein
MARRPNTDVEPTKCRYRCEEMDIADALMMLTKEELEQVEVTLDDGSVVRPFRFCELSPDVRLEGDVVVF